MGRIGASLSGIERTLLNRLSEANTAATINSLRLATGKKINAPSDDVSAFAKLASFQTQLSVVSATMSNVTAASSMITQAQSSLDEVRTQLLLQEIVPEYIPQPREGSDTVSSGHKAKAEAEVGRAQRAA